MNDDPRRSRRARWGADGGPERSDPAPWMGLSRFPRRLPPAPERQAGRQRPVRRGAGSGLVPGPGHRGDRFLPGWLSCRSSDECSLGIWSSDRKVGARRIPAHILESAAGLMIRLVSTVQVSYGAHIRLSSGPQAVLIDVKDDRRIPAYGRCWGGSGATNGVFRVDLRRRRLDSAARSIDQRTVGGTSMAGLATPGARENEMPEIPTTAVDPVCGMTIDRNAAILVNHAGASYHFCDIACADTFRAEPERWVTGLDRGPLEHTRH